MCPSDTWMEEGKSERQRQMGQNTLLGFAHGQAGSPDPSLTHGVQQEGELAGGGEGQHLTLRRARDCSPSEAAKIEDISNLSNQGIPTHIFSPLSLPGSWA